ncbi:MAG: hypothetical protein LAO55_03845 [Acidobacteriia bacterium]|nr:hypothetical protein [Terriglobia bacterium]
MLTASALDEGDNHLSVYIHDEAASFRFQIEGRLAGNAARQLEQSWRTALSVIGNRSLVITVGYLSGIDPSGRALLCRWREAGAQFVAKSPLAKTLVSSIVGEPVTSETSVAKSVGWGWLRGYALPLVPLVMLLSPGTVSAASLGPATVRAWEEYVEAANKRMERRLRPDKTFLWVDEAPDRLARVRAGEILVSPLGARTPARVPSGLIHDWIGAVFIPNVSIQDALAVVSDYAHYKEFYQPAVIDSKTIATSEAKDQFSMLLMNKSFFARTALDADYESCYVRVDDRRGYSVSRTTRIQEIEEYGAPTEHALHEGEGHGIIWRLFGITRYVERDGGVYIELEAIGLSRDIPASLRWLVEPIVRRVSRGSLLTSLQQTENAVRLRDELANSKAGNRGSIASTARASHPSR